MRASDYIGISEGIRSREIKLQNELLEINSKISSLQNTLDSLESELDILEMELDAALSDTDEDGNVDMRRVGAIRARMGAVSSRIGGCQSELSEQENVKHKIEDELQTVESEKQQTLSQIQSAANLKNQNLSRLSGGLSGDYASIGQNLQSAFQMSLGQLSQAASILGGNISASRNGGTGGGVALSSQSAAKTSGNTAMVGGIGSRSPSTMSSPSAGNSVQTQSAVLSSVIPSLAKRSSKSSPKSESHQMSAQKHTGNSENLAFLFPKNVMPLSSPVSNFVSDDEAVTSTPQGDLPSSPHTFKDYLNPANYDSHGHYIGDYRSPVTQTTQALQDYNNWSNGGGIGLPSVDLRQNGGAIQSMVPAQNVFEVLDADAPDFWCYKSRPQSDYIAMATYIPLVKKYLESGKSLSDVEGMGGIIGACATNYFRNPVKVMKAGEAYIHCNDGRHRTVAAQIAKVEMPVCIVQDYSTQSNNHASSNLTPISIEQIYDGDEFRELMPISEKVKVADRNSDVLEWIGDPADSKRVPKDSWISEELRRYGVDGIEYKNGDVDFSPVSKFDINGNIKEMYNQLGQEIKATDVMGKSRSDLNKLIRRKWQSKMKQFVFEKILIDSDFAHSFSEATGIDTRSIISADSLSKALRENGLTLHETPDCTKIQLVPTEIHYFFKHSGGVAEMLEKMINADIRASLYVKIW